MHELLAYDRDRRRLYGALPEAADFLRSVGRAASEKQVLNRLVVDLRGRRTYLDVTIRYQEPERKRMTSFVGLAFDADYQPKPALKAIIDAVARAKA